MGVYGVCNTYFRADKLFPGPHLFAGAAICVGWALAAACVPFMEKGNETARNLHIALNVVIAALFAWQLPTGFEIAMKVWGLSISWCLAACLGIGRPAPRSRSLL